MVRTAFMILLFSTSSILIPSSGWLPLTSASVQFLITYWATKHFQTHTSLGNQTLNEYVRGVGLREQVVRKRFTWVSRVCDSMSRESGSSLTTDLDTTTKQ